jgi:hypothetical protein
MNFSAVLSQLKEELSQLEVCIRAFEELQRISDSGPPRRGRPPKWPKRLAVKVRRAAGSK